MLRGERLEGKEDEDEERQLVVAHYKFILEAIEEVTWCIGIMGSFCVRCPFDYFCTFPRPLTV